MKLTEKLIGYLNRVFNKGPDQSLALRLQYDGTSMQWAVADGYLTTVVVGGSGAALKVPLAQFSVSSLASYLGSQDGYSVPYVTTGSVASKSALVLIDGTGNPAQSNGDHLYAFQSALWAYMNGQATELTAANASIGEALLQMAANSASDVWVDEHGGYYGVLRKSGEADAAYAARIVAEIGRARGNGVAIGEAVKIAAGASYVVVNDYGTVTTSSGGVQSYGLFDMDVEVPVDSPLSQTEIVANTTTIVESMRDAGTFLRTLRYIRTATLNGYVGSYLKAGHNVQVNWGGARLFLDGSWSLDGSYRLSGYRVPAS